MRLINGMVRMFDWTYYHFRFSKFGQYLILAYNTTFDDILLIPRKSLESRKSANTETKLTKKLKLNIPIVSSNMDTVTGVDMAIALAEMGGLGLLYRLTNSIEEEAKMIRQVKEAGLAKGKNYPVGASIGVKGDFIERAKSLIEAGADIIVFDIANGYSHRMASAIKKFKSIYPNMPIIAGNVATPGGVDFLAKLGVDCIKVGIGPGSVCTTRIVTGHGVPQLSAIFRCAQKAKKYGIPIIADGGIRYSGDIVKALAVGADAVMLGSLLAGTLESPGEVYYLDKKGNEKLAQIKELKNINPRDYPKYFKIYRGMSGKDVQLDAKKKKGIDLGRKIVPEGVSKRITYKGSAILIIEQLVGGLKSGMSYSYSKTIKQLQKRAIFEKVSPLGQKENTPHAEEFKHYR